MKILFTDASFDWNHTDATDEPIVRGKIATSGEGISAIEKVAIGKVEGLKQYINILELTAIARAVELASMQEWQDAELRISSDSRVAVAWAHNKKVHPKVRTLAHDNALEYLAKALALYGGKVHYYFVPRETNPAGHLLQAELDTGKKPYEI